MDMLCQYHHTMLDTPHKYVKQVAASSAHRHWGVIVHFPLKDGTSPLFLPHTHRQRLE